MEKTHTSQQTAEIEVTPEMIDAGMRELGRFNDYFDHKEVGAFKIFAAMCRASGVWVALRSPELKKQPLFSSGKLLEE